MRTPLLAEGRDETEREPALDNIRGGGSGGGGGGDLGVLGVILNRFAQCVRTAGTARATLILVWSLDV